MTGLRVFNFRELLERFHDAGALAARGGDDDIYLRVARGCLLQNRFAGAEGARDAVGSTDGHWEEGIDGAYGRFERFRRFKPFGVAFHRHLHRPALHHLHFGFDTLVVGEHGNIFRDGILAGGSHAFDRIDSAQAEGNHYFVAWHRLVVEYSFGYPPEKIAGGNFVARLRGGVEIPFFIARQAGQVHSALQEVTRVGRNLRRLDGQLGERVLQSVIHLCEHSRPEFRGEQFARELDLVANRQIDSGVENLHVAALSAHADNFGHQAFVA